MSTGELERPELVQVPPSALITTSNLREALTLDGPFLASIAAQGVLVPIVATRTDTGDLAIDYGHRRAAAAVQVGLSTVPVVVMPAAASEAARLMAQLSENDRRAGLTTSEELTAHEQLALLGVSVADAARTLGTDQDTVRDARKVAANPTSRAGAEYGLDLQDALLLAEFDDDPNFVQYLTEVALDSGRDDMLRAAERRRQDIATDRAVADQERDWQQRGYAIIDVRDDQTATTVLHRIRDADGDPLTGADHTSCPGRAVKLTGWSVDNIRAIEYCIDADEHHPGQVQHYQASSAQQTPDPQAKAEQRARVIVNNKEWRAAEPVRREHVRAWLERAKPTPEIVRWLVGQLLDPGPLQAAWQTRRALADLRWAGDVLRPVSMTPGSQTAGETVQLQPTASQPRSVMAALGWLLVDRECGTSVESWRTRQHVTANYLGFLEKHTGYTLGPVEQLAAGRTPAPADASAAKEEEHADADVDPPAVTGDDPLAAEDGHSMSGAAKAVR